MCQAWPFLPVSQLARRPWEEEAFCLARVTGSGDMGPLFCAQPSLPVAWGHSCPGPPPPSSLPQPSPGLGCPQGLLTSQLRPLPSGCSGSWSSGLAPLWPLVLCLPRYPLTVPLVVLQDTQAQLHWHVLGAQATSEGGTSEHQAAPRGCPSSGAGPCRGPWGWRASCLPSSQPLL